MASPKADDEPVQDDLLQQLQDSQGVTSGDVVPPFSAVAEGSRLESFAAYQQMYAESVSDNALALGGFWDKMAKQSIDWFQPYTSVSQGSFATGDIAWYMNGKLNACYNCVDRHVQNGLGDKTAILFEADEPGKGYSVTYTQLLAEVCRLANALRRLGVRKGDTVCIYMPMVPEAAYAMLACARVGAIHSVVFAGFSADSVRDRILDCKCRVVLTADQGLRGGRTIELKSAMDVALGSCPLVKSVVVLQHTRSKKVAASMMPGRDSWYHDLVAAERPYAPCEAMDSEDLLFMLYTSGSTGKPKGIAHSTGGYMVYATLTTAHIFNLRPDDIYACVADIGWITGHSYIVYGPLSNGTTTLMFESTPLYPDAGRYWQMVQQHKITQLYTAPTAIRALMAHGTEVVKKYDRSSLRVLGSVGEPINPEAWKWYFEVVGDSKVGIVDTFWQTETGGVVLTPLPGVTPMKPGSATFPFFGIVPSLRGEKGAAVVGNGVKGVLCFDRPWPGIARTIYGDHARYLLTYMQPYKGCYFTGDGATRDSDGFYWITGRVDDVINVSGHRIGSAEIESALVTHPLVVEAACIGIPHDIKGQGLFCYVTVAVGTDVPSTLIKECRDAVRRDVGPFAGPDYIVVTAALPKTRSGKIMRRLLRKIATDESSPEQLGDISTLADPGVVATIIEEVKAMRAGHGKGSPTPSAAARS